MPEEPGAIFDAHVRAEFVERSVEATMATMTDAPYVTHVPVMTGGYGRDQVRQFYADWFVGRWPADMPARSREAAGRRRRAGGETARPHAAVERTDPPRATAKGFPCQAIVEASPRQFPVVRSNVIARYRKY